MLIFIFQKTREKRAGKPFVKSRYKEGDSRSRWIKILTIKKPQRNQKIKTLETSDLMYFACVSHSQDVNLLLPPQCPLLPTVHRIPAYQCKKNSALQQFVFSQGDFSSAQWSISPKIKHLNTGDWTPVQLQRVLGRKKLKVIDVDRNGICLK